MIRLSIATIIALSSPLCAQWLDYPNAGIPRMADGKANLSAPAPKTTGGRPDLSGIWEISEAQSAYGPFASHFMDLAVDLKPEEAPFQPWAKALSQQRQANLHKDDPLARCLPPGVPRIDTIAPFKIVQTGQLVIVLYETTANSAFRQIFTDGRALPKDPNPTWNGYSTAHWDGDTLVVETSGFRDDLWLDAMGNPLTDQAK